MRRLECRLPAQILANTMQCTNKRRISADSTSLHNTGGRAPHGRVD